MLCIVLDTNIINSGSLDFTILRFIPKLEEIIRELEATDYVNQIKILLPRIVIDELFVHQLEDYQSQKDRLKGLKIPNSTLEFNGDYKSYLEGLLDQQLSLFKTWDFPCEVIPYPNNTCLSCIIQRALEKKPPFEGSNKNSDKGFKDVVLWESILEYKRAHIDEDLLLFSQDKRLVENELKKEFFAEFKSDITLVPRTSDNDNRPLYDTVAKFVPVLMRQEKQSFSESIKKRIRAVVNESNMLHLWEGLTIDHSHETIVCRGFSCLSAEIVSIDDIEEGKITQYLVDAHIQIFGDAPSSSINLGAACSLLLEYCIDDDSIYLRKYNSPELGYERYGFKELLMNE